MPLANRQVQWFVRLPRLMVLPMELGMMGELVGPMVCVL